MGFEDALESSMFRGVGERTYIDKVLAKNDVDAIRALVKKTVLTREDLLEILYLLSGTEAKLVNYSEWDRYIILKFFVWIREFVKICEILFDYEDELKKKVKQCKYCLKVISKEDIKTKCVCENPAPVMQLTERTQRLLNNNSLLLQHNAKFLIDLYLNIARTSLSVQAVGLLELLKNKYEVIYPSQQGTQTVENKGGGLFGLRKG